MNKQESSESYGQLGAIPTQKKVFDLVTSQLPHSFRRAINDLANRGGISAKSNYRGNKSQKLSIFRDY